MSLLKAVDNIPTPVIAGMAVSAPGWVTAIEHINAILALVLTVLGLLIAILKIRGALRPRPDPRQVAEEFAKKLLEERVERTEELKISLQDLDKKDPPYGPKK